MYLIHGRFSHFSSRYSYCVFKFIMTKAHSKTGEVYEQFSTFHFRFLFLPYMVLRYKQDCGYMVT